MFTIIDNADHAEWLKARSYGIGGSDAAAVIGKSPYKSNVELLMKRQAGRWRKIFQTSRMYSTGMEQSR